MPAYERALVNLHLAPCPAGLVVAVDRKELVGAIVNLLENAQQACEAGAVVSVRAVLIGTDVCIEIVDTGAGMSQIVQARLFEPFFTTRKEGTGLGLAIVRNLMELYGGSITVESTEGRGSLFRLCLPMSTAASKV
jgi:two-component system sensor histidine kinase FlrB